MTNAARRDLDELARERFPFGRKFDEATFATWKATTPTMKAAKWAVEAWCGDPGAPRWLIVHGLPGTGKTHLLAAAYWYHVAALSPEGLFWSLGSYRHPGLPCIGYADALVNDLISQVYRPGESYDARPPATLREAARRALGGPGRVVILDDFGVAAARTSQQSAPWRESLYHLFDVLYGGERRLLMATNLDPKHGREGLPRLADALGARVWDRVIECAQFVACDWASARRP